MHVMPQIYTGRDCGKIIEPLLQKAKKRIWVATPYISEEYASLLALKAREGVEVRVLTVDLSENRKAIAQLRSGARQQVMQQRSVPLLIIAVLMLVLSIVSTLFETVFRGLLVIPLYVFKAMCELLLLIRYWYAWIGVTVATVVVMIVTNSISVESALNIHTFLAIVVLIAMCIAEIIRRKHVVEELRVDLRVVPKSKFVHSKILIVDDIGIIGSANLTKAGLWHNIETIAIFSGEEIKKVEEAFNNVWKAV